MITKTVSIPASTTLGVRREGSSDFNLETNLFSIDVEETNDLHYAAYEFAITDVISDTFFEHTLNPVITKVELQYWHFKADTVPDAESLEFVQLLEQPSVTHLAQDIHADIQDLHAVVYGSQEVHGVNKTQKTIVLGDGTASLAAITMQNAVDSRSFFAVGVRINQSLTTDGAIQLGGKILRYGTGTDWESASSTNQIEGPPTLVIYYQLDEEAHIDLQMRYTTSDPTTTQNTPINSVGGYASSNLVYTRVDLGDHINNNQTTITVSPSNSLPSKASGLVQIGPEILKYEGLDASNNQLIDVTRGISPSASFPASTEPHVEKISYLEIDNLFNNRPSVGLKQFRCVAIINTTGDRPAQEVKIFLRQNIKSDVQIDVGIEIPEFDTHLGSQYSIQGSDGQIITDDTNFINFTTGFFDGGHMVIQSESALVESFDVDDTGLATFILDRNVGSVNPNVTFRINPAPSQIALNDVQKPVENSGRFFGFIGDGGSNQIGFGNLRENGDELLQYDLFYIWVKRTLVSNVDDKDDTGAVLIVQFIDGAAS